MSNYKIEIDDTKDKASVSNDRLSCGQLED